MKIKRATKERVLKLSAGIALCDWYYWEIVKHLWLYRWWWLTIVWSTIFWRQVYGIRFYMLSMFWMGWKPLLIIDSLNITASIHSALLPNQMPSLPLSSFQMSWALTWPHSTWLTIFLHSNQGIGLNNRDPSFQL